MKFAFLALRNVFRQKRRTLATLSPLILGLAGLVIFQGVIAQMMSNLRDSTIVSGLGHLELAADEAFFLEGEFNPFAFGMADAKDLLDALARDQRVKAAFPSLGFTAIAGYGEKSMSLLVKGFPAERMAFADSGDFGAVGDAVDRGDFMLGSSVSGSCALEVGGNGLILGETAARILKVGPGEVLTLVAILPGGGLNAADFTVTGIFKMEGKDKIFAFVDYTSASALLLEPQAPVVHVLAKDIRDSAILAAEYGPSRVAKPWQELASYYIQINTMFEGFLRMIRLILLLIILFILGNTMNRVVFERMREWGTLRAIGTKGRQVIGLVILEGCFQGLIGSLIGIALGFGVCALVNGFGGLAFAVEGGTFYLRLSPDGSSIWGNLLPVLLTAALAGIMPALRAIRTSPADSLRHE